MGGGVGEVAVEGLEDGGAGPTGDVEVAQVPFLVEAVEDVFGDAQGEHGVARHGVVVYNRNKRDGV